MTATVEEGERWHRKKKRSNDTGAFTGWCGSPRFPVCSQSHLNPPPLSLSVPAHSGNIRL